MLHIDLDAIEADNAQAILDSKSGINTGGGQNGGVREDDKALPGNDNKTDTSVDKASIQKLYDITQQQRSQIDESLSHFKSLSADRGDWRSSTPPPLWGKGPGGVTSSRQASQPSQAPSQSLTGHASLPLQPVDQGPTGIPSQSSQPVADLVMGPLTAALSKLSDVIDLSASIKTKGILL